jgi:hypothetical protein
MPKLMMGAGRVIEERGDDLDTCSKLSMLAFTLQERGSPSR